MIVSTPTLQAQVEGGEGYMALVFPPDVKISEVTEFVSVLGSQYKLVNLDEGRDDEEVLVDLWDDSQPHPDAITRMALSPVWVERR